MLSGVSRVWPGVTLLGLAPALLSQAASAPTPTAVSPAASMPERPAYTASGQLLLPANYREWIYLSSGFDMSYRPGRQAEHHEFDNVFVNPTAYKAFVQTGRWPDGTLFVLEVRAAEGKGSINTSGNYQGAGVMELEMHVKDEGRFPGKWAFFSFGGATEGTLLPQSAECYACHAAHAAVDTTFVQFYPTLLPIARSHGTLSAGYRAENPSTGNPPPRRNQAWSSNRGRVEQAWPGRATATQGEPRGPGRTSAATGG